MFHMPAYSEIPNVGLYLEQTLKYINDTFAGFKSIELTKSMISNYVKLGYLRRPVRKQYDREQIASLLFIALSKQVLSMENIGKLLRILSRQDSRSEDSKSDDSSRRSVTGPDKSSIDDGQMSSIESAYEAFRADFDYLLDSVFNQKVMDSQQVIGFMRPDIEEADLDGAGIGAALLDGAVTGASDLGASGEDLPSLDAPGSAAAARPVPDPYILLWQIAAADVYSLYLNELFEADGSGK